MMTEYITNEGYTLLSKMLSGECKINFTRVEMGSGTPGESDLKKMKALSKAECSVEVESVEIENDKTVDVTARFTNATISREFYFKEKGIYASDGSREILFSYAYTTDPEIIPSNTQAYMEKRLKSIMTQLQDTTGEILIDVKSGIYVALSDYKSDMEKVNNDLGNVSEKLDNLSTNINDIKNDLDKKAPSTHTHTKSQITDFPTSLPASDVYSWAKASSKPTYNGTELKVGGSGTYKDSTVESAISTLNSNLTQLEYSDVAGGRNIFQLEKRKCGSMVGNDLVLAHQVGEFYEYDWKPNTQYTISFVGRNSTSNGRQRLYFKYTDGSDGEAITNYETSFAYVSVTSEAGKTIKSINSYWGADGSLIIKDAEIMIEEGDTATPYEPYIPSVKMLAEENEQQNTEAMDLKMLGWTVPSECPVQNYVDGNGIFHQRVGRVDLGTLDWSYGSDTTRFSTTGIIDYKKKDSSTNTWIANAFLKDYNTVSGDDTASDSYDKSIGFNGINNMFFVRNTSYTDATSFKNAMQGQYLYYELATEITTNVDGNEAVAKVSDSLDAQGLLNKFDGDLLVGKVYASSDGSLTTNYTYVCNRNKIYCYENDIVHIRTKNTAQIIALYYNENEYISYKIVNSNQCDFIVPSGTTYMNFDIQDNTLSPSDIHIYINNEIEQIKNDLAALDENKANKDTVANDLAAVKSFIGEEWDENKSYVVYDACICDGENWICTSNNKNSRPKSSSLYWAKADTLLELITKKIRTTDWIEKTTDSKGVITLSNSEVPDAYSVFKILECYTNINEYFLLRSTGNTYLVVNSSMQPQANVTLSIQLTYWVYH